MAAVASWSFARTESSWPRATQQPIRALEALDVVVAPESVDLVVCRGADQVGMALRAVVAELCAGDEIGGRGGEAGVIQ